MSIKIKNDFDGSNPTAEMPKISFSCGARRKHSFSKAKTVLFLLFVI